ncbi:YceD family protein [Nitrosococcus watsonii]|uniref:Large ribosomal RNA subunit accumulation protein YceD n=1 Tax=Nitrosococcus watsoni (strain C-113) TaxID=105559 RepID=D8K647_NITWC|nr:YceD family protein [Nitrosococcus watsonii]ADJ28374.1 protein of unknown function DUF177 [Nitrosococcus watsonii C-113]
MPTNLSDHVLPWKLAQSGQRIQGRVPLICIPGLELDLLDKEGFAEAELSFNCNKEGRCFVRGHVKARLRLACQRCLQPVDIVVDTQIGLELVVNETEIYHWPDSCEQWIVKPEETASLWRLVREELLLALPIAVSHPLGECSEAEIPDLIE